MTSSWRSVGLFYIIFQCITFGNSHLFVQCIQYLPFFNYIQTFQLKKIMEKFICKYFSNGCVIFTWFNKHFIDSLVNVIHVEKHRQNGMKSLWKQYTRSITFQKRTLFFKTIYEEIISTRRVCITTIQSKGKYFVKM